MSLEFRVLLAMATSGALAWGYLRLAARFVDLSHLPPLELRNRRARTLFGFLIAGLACALFDPAKPGWTLIMIGMAPLHAGAMLGTRGESVGVLLGLLFAGAGLAFHIWVVPG